MRNKRERPAVRKIGVYELELAHKRQLLEDASVVIGCDVMSRREFVVFGRNELRQVAKGRPHGDVLFVELDQETDELEFLCAVCEMLKGRHEYLPS
jgi:hypothetical protein